MGSAGTVSEEHDSGGVLFTTIPASTTWVQTSCKFTAVDPPDGTLMIKVFPEGAITITEPYVGEVDASYPAAACEPKLT